MLCCMLERPTCTLSWAITCLSAARLYLGSPRMRIQRRIGCSRALGWRGRKVYGDGGNTAIGGSRRRLGLATSRVTALASQYCFVKATEMVLITEVLCFQILPAMVVLLCPGSTIILPELHLHFSREAGGLIGFVEHTESSRAVSMLLMRLPRSSRKRSSPKILIFLLWVNQY